MATRVLVTGASGFIAQHTILQLLDKGYEAGLIPQKTTVRFAP